MKIIVLVMLVAATALSASAQAFGSSGPASREYRRYRDVQREREIYRQQRKLDRLQERADREYYKNCPVPNVSRGEAPMKWSKNNPYRPFWPSGLSNKPDAFGVTDCGNVVYYNCNQGIQGVGLAGSYFIVMKYGDRVGIYKNNLCIREIAIYPGMLRAFEVPGGCVQFEVGLGSNYRDECYFNWYAPGGKFIESYLLY